ncbi:MAG: hypothetical protein WA691_03515 [Thermoplasmata archaeon]
MPPASNSAERRFRIARGVSIIVKLAVLAGILVLIVVYVGGR